MTEQSITKQEDSSNEDDFEHYFNGCRRLSAALKIEEERVASLTVELNNEKQARQEAEAQRDLLANTLRGFIAAAKVMDKGGTDYEQGADDTAAEVADIARAVLRGIEGGGK